MFLLVQMTFTGFFIFAVIDFITSSIPMKDPLASVSGFPKSKIYHIPGIFPFLSHSFPLIWFF